LAEQCHVRPYRPADRDAVYDICVRTGDNGEDATGKYEDPELIPSIFAGPYVHFEPELAFVLDDGGRAVGYVLGTADTARFLDVYRRDWLPGLLERWPAVSAAPATAEERMIAFLHSQREGELPPELGAFPAHLHIDILPGYQGHGWGRALMNAFLHRLHEAGVPAVHLSVSPANTNARAFYARLGFEPIVIGGQESQGFFGRSTANGS
jgi:ribosomal protein S18 acetylase RimI-like enzyme